MVRIKAPYSSLVEQVLSPWQQLGVRFHPWLVFAACRPRSTLSCRFSSCPINKGVYYFFNESCRGHCILTFCPLRGSIAKTSSADMLR